MTEYMVMLHRSDDRDAALHPAEFERARAAHDAFQQHCADNGWPIISDARRSARPPARASLRPDGRGGLAVTDGPYSETAEQVGGFYLVAAHLARRPDRGGRPRSCSTASHVEIRPTVSSSTASPWTATTR